MRVDERSTEGARRSTSRGTRELTAAFGMLTRIPVGQVGREVSGTAAYGLVGAAVGGLGGLVMLVLGGTVPLVAAVLAIAAMAVVSGAVHLDGLADTADALLAPDASAAEAARKDPAIGSGGAAALVLVLAAQVAALASLASDAGQVAAAAACVAAGAASRSLPVITALMRGGAASRGGLGSSFADRVSAGDAAAATVTTVLVAVLSGAVAGSIALSIGVAIGFALGIVLAGALLRVRRQLDGDLLGAVVELGSAAVLAAAAVAMTVSWPAR